MRSNSEDFFLTWHITLPGNESVNITYSNNDSLGIVVLLLTNPPISSDLTEFVPNQLIESIIILTAPDSGSLMVDGTVLECVSSGNSASEVIESDFSPGNT